MKHFVFVFMLMVVQTITAQPEIFGYFESEVDGIDIGTQKFNFGYNKFRFDIMATPDEMVTVWANLNIQKFYGKTIWDLRDFIPEKSWKPIFQSSDVPNSLWASDSLLNLLFTFPLSDTLYLDNVYAMLSFSRFDVTVGKQQLSLGTGYVWNPLDIFNRKQLLDPTYEQTGVTAIRLEVPFKNRVSLDVILSPGINWGYSTRMVQTKLGIGRFDVTATAAKFLWERTRFDLQSDTFFSVVKLNRTMVGGALVGEIADFGIWAEGGWNKVDGNHDFTEIVVGLDHTFDSQTYLLMEMYHNGDGIKHSDSLSFIDYMTYYTGETHSLMQDYGFLLLTHPITDLVTFSLFGIFNFNDESMVLNPQLDWNVFENVNINLLFSHFEGSDADEFGIQNWGMRLRLRAYF